MIYGEYDDEEKYEDNKRWLWQASTGSKTKNLINYISNITTKYYIYKILENIQIQNTLTIYIYDNKLLLFFYNNKKFKK